MFVRASCIISPGRNCCEEHGQDTGQKYAVESALVADRGDRSTKARNVTEVQDISTDQRAHAAADIGELCRLLSRQEERYDSRSQRGIERSCGRSDIPTGVGNELHVVGIERAKSTLGMQVSHRVGE